MEISVVTTIPYPLEQVFAAMRDHLPELAAYMPNVDSIVVESREELSEHRVQLVNRWNAAKTEIPPVARPFVDASRMFWTDYADWESDLHRCSWRLKTGFMSDNVNCKGTTTYVATEADRTELRISGMLSLDLRGLLPRFVIKRATKGVEKFVIRLVQPNFQKTADALTAYLNAQKE
jgi:hypothetical protein